MATCTYICSHLVLADTSQCPLQWQEGDVMSEPMSQMSCEPVSSEEFSEWFDSDGRLVKEVTMRQRVFEGLLTFIFIHV